MNKTELRLQASIAILNSLLETTSHSVIECLAIKDLYAKIAVVYADALVKALDEPTISIDELKKECKEYFKIGELFEK